MEPPDGFYGQQRGPSHENPFTDPSQSYHSSYPSSSLQPQQAHLKHQQQFFSTEPEPSLLGPAFQFEALTSQQSMPFPNQHVDILSSSIRSCPSSIAPPALPASSPSGRQPLSIITQSAVLPSHSSSNPVQHFHPISPNSLTNAFPKFAQAVETHQGGEWGRPSPSASQQSSYFPSSHPSSPNRDPSLYAPSLDSSQSYHHYPPSAYSTRPRSTTVNSNAFSPISGSILHTPSTTSGHSPSQTSSFNFPAAMSSHESPMLSSYPGESYADGMSGFQPNQMDFVGRGADDSRDGLSGFRLDEEMGGARKLALRGGTHTSTPDLSERVKALSLESKLRDIEKILAASSSVTQQAAAMKKAILDGRELEIPNDGGNLKEISRTLNAIASLDLPSQLIPSSSAPPLLTPTALFPTASASAVPPLDTSAFADVSMSGRDESGPGGLENVQVYSQAVPPTLTVDVVKSLTSKRPAPLSSPNPISENSATKFPRHSDDIEQPQATLLAPPPLLHSHSFPSVEHQVLPSEEEQQNLLSHTPQPRSTSSLGVPALESTSPDHGSYPSSLHVSQQHIPIVPSPLAISSRPPSPTPVDQYGEPPMMTIEQPMPMLPDMANSLDWSVPPSAHLSSQSLEPQPDEPLVYASLAYPSLSDAFPPAAAPGPSSQAPRLASTRPPSRRSSTAEGRPVIRLRGNTMGSDAELPSFLRPAESRASQSHLHSAPYPPSSYQHPHLTPHHPPPSSLSQHPSQQAPLQQTQQQPVLQPPAAQYQPQPPQQSRTSVSRRSSRSCQSDSPAETFPEEPAPAASLNVESDSDDEAYVAPKGKKSSKRKVSVKRDAESGVDPIGPTIPDELKARVDVVFHRYLTNICNNIDAKDAKGEAIHQVLMAKKMQRLDESWDFRPFKFRIQAFTNAFFVALLDAGIAEDQLPQKRTKQYLWDSSLISRYNDDGKKAKSKGNHVWLVSARKDGAGGWIFKNQERKIMGSLSHAFAGVPFSWRPHIWDPHVASADIQYVFSSPAGGIPPWLSWKDNQLSGVPPPEARSQTIEVTATDVEGGSPQLHSSIDLVVASFATFDVNPTFSSFAPSQTFPSPPYSAATQSFSTNFSQPLPSTEPMQPPAFQQPQEVFAPDVQGYDEAQEPFHPFPLSTFGSALEAEAAVQQSVEEKTGGIRTNAPLSDPQLVAECAQITTLVLTDAHRSRQTQFLAEGYVSQEFTQASLDNARSRAIVAVRTAASILGPQATSSDVIKCGEMTLTQAAGGFM